MNPTELKTFLDKTWDLLNEHALEAEDPILQSNDPQTVKMQLNNDLPLGDESFDKILLDFKDEILPFLNHNTSPNFGAYITGSGNKVGAIAEFIKAYYNQNGLKWNNSPIASELEQLIIQWVAKFCHVPTHSKGVITSGGSMSNLMAIHFALADRFPEREVEGIGALPKLTIYCSDQTHSSIDRATVFLGLGRKALRKIPVNRDFQIDTKNLVETIEIDLSNGFVPLMVIGNAGTTNTGSIDPLDELAAIANEYRMWFHVDGAYGLPAIRLPELKNQFSGVEKADSIIINPHKWMYVPFEASCVLLKSIPQAIHFSPDYLFTENPGERWESSNHTIELSKEFRALKIWFTMKYFGIDQLTSYVKKDIEMIHYLGELLQRIQYIQVEPAHPLSILCFRYHDTTKNDMENEEMNIKAIRKIETEGKIFITGTRLHGSTYLRVYYGNPERTKKHVSYMVEVIKEAFQ